jgi:hypothetical protein
MLAGYGVALAGYPRWAIANAARKFVRGEVAGQSLAFCPRPPELATVVRAEMMPVYRQVEREAQAAAQRRDMAELRARPVPTDASRQRVAALVADLHRDDAARGGDKGGSALDPALLAMVPDAPTTFERLRWIERGGGHG